MECGYALASGATAAVPAARRSPAGFVVFGGFLLAGLGIWAAVLTPDPPPPPLGGKRPAATAAAAPPAQEPVELPAEIKRMVGELATKAAAKPDDLGIWTHLGEVYYRTAQFDPSYYPKAMEAFDHVLARDAKRPEALRGKGNVHYDRNEPALAIPLYERYLAIKGDDASVETDLATMHLYSGDAPKAIGMYKTVLAKHPEFVQAHYNLAAAHHEQGDDEAALGALRTARRFATDERIQQQIEQMIARLSGEAPPPAAATRPAAVASAPAAAGQTPFQQAIERDLRAHSIVGPRIVELRWTAPGRVEARMREFPMAQMPPMARTAFEKRMTSFLETARTAHPVEGEIAIVIVDAGSGETMATITPS